MAQYKPGLKYKHLRTIAKDLKIQGYSKMRKHEFEIYVNSKCKLKYLRKGASNVEVLIDDLGFKELWPYLALDFLKAIKEITYSPYLPNTKESRQRILTSLNLKKKFFEETYLLRKLSRTSQGNGITI